MKYCPLSIGEARWPFHVSIYTFVFKLRQQQQSHTACFGSQTEQWIQWEQSYNPWAVMKVAALLAGGQLLGFIMCACKCWPILPRFFKYCCKMNSFMCYCSLSSGSHNLCAAQGLCEGDIDLLGFFFKKKKVHLPTNICIHIIFGTPR